MPRYCVSVAGEMPPGRRIEAAEESAAFELMREFLHDWADTVELELELEEDDEDAPVCDSTP